MARYQLTATQKTIFDGQLVQEGAVIGVLETELPLGNVLAAASLGSVRSTLLDEAQTVAVVARVEPAYAGRRESAPPTAEVDPDQLNAEDLAADEAERAAAEEEAKKAAEAAAIKAKDSTGNAIPEHTLVGLNPRIAAALAKQALPSREKIQEYLAAGKKLEDLDEIGVKAAEAITAWLGA